MQAEAFEYNVCNTKYVACEMPLSQRYCALGQFYPNGIESFSYVVSGFTLWLEN